MFTGLLAIVLVFGLIIVVHEWGHMMAAKLCGVAVPDFAIGMGPSLWSRVWRGTRYHICAIPIGGYVQIAGLTGDDPVNSSVEAKRQRAQLDELLKQGQTEEAAALEASFAAAAAAIPAEATNGGRLTKRWQDINGFQRSFILVAGVMMNFVLALVVMVLMGFAGFPDNRVVIDGVESGLPAAEAGLRAGDVLEKADNVAIEDREQFMDIVQAHANQPLTLLVLRGKEELTLTATPRSTPGYNGGKVSLGVGLPYVSQMTNTVSLVELNSSASDLGIRRGDRIVAVNGEPITDGLELLVALPGVDDKLNPVDADNQPIKAGGGVPVQITVENAKGSHEITIPGDVSQISLGLLFTPRLQKLPPLAAMRRSLHDGMQMMVALFSTFKLLFTKVGAKSISGPIGIFSMLGQSAQSDWHSFLTWVILINLNLAIMNLLPLPALDGGRLLFVGLAGLGVRIPERREALVHAAGMLMLLAFILLVSVRDVGGLVKPYLKGAPPASAKK